MTPLPERPTPADVAAAVHDIRTMVGDDEAAHSAEDGLYLELLRAIADGRCDDPSACALAALESQKIDFQRWCA